MQTRILQLFIILLFSILNATKAGTNNSAINKSTPSSIAKSDDPYVLYKHKFYADALEKFLPEFKNNNEDVDMAFKIGYCYLYGTLDYNKAIPYFKKAAESGKGQPDSYFMLGKAFQFSGMFDYATNAFKKSIETLAEKSWSGDEIDDIKFHSSKEIENCAYAKLMIKTPADVTFENLGKDVNTPFAEIDPYITPSKTELVFTSNRADGNQCEKPRKYGYTYDVYMSVNKAGKWTKAFNMGPSINTPLNERVSSISSDGGTMFLYIDNEESSKDGDIYVSTSSAKQFTTPINLKGLVNTSSEESSASISFDGSKLYFASDRSGGYGGKDIYVAKKLPSGDWAEPKKLSDKVNTNLNEDFPVIMPDDRTLYFASEGHNNFGGFDIFKCEWIDSLNNWSEPENLGYPVNTVQDNFSISVTEKKHEGYIAAIRPEGFGGYDIYKIIFNQAETAPYSILRAKIFGTAGTELNTDVKVTITNKKTNAVIGKYNISAKKKGKMFAVMHAGEYKLEFENELNPPYSTDLIIIDKNTRGELINKDFILSSSADTPSPPEQPLKKEVKTTKKVTQKK